MAIEGVYDDDPDRWRRARRGQGRRLGRERVRSRAGHLARDGRTPPSRPSRASSPRAPASAPRPASPPGARPAPPTTTATPGSAAPRPDITACVWVGHAESREPMLTEFGGAPVDGGTIPALIFADVVNAYLSLNEEASDTEVVPVAPPTKRRWFPKCPPSRSPPPSRSRPRKPVEPGRARGSAEASPDQRRAWPRHAVPSRLPGSGARGSGFPRRRSATRAPSPA